MSSPVRPVRSGLLKYSIDTYSILVVVLALGLSLTPFLVQLPAWAAVLVWVAALYARSFCAFCQHNHGHLGIFNSRAAGFLFDALLAQATGYPTALWELHHNRGHHRNYLEPEKDVASVKVPGTGQAMSRWWYSVRGNLTIHLDSVRIGLAEGRAGKKTLLPKLALETLVQVLVTGALLWWDVKLALLYFVLPNLIVSFTVWWESYPHHKGLGHADAYCASITVEDDIYNWFTFNIGHHTAHHEKPTLHWSLLPRRTAQIRDRISADCFRTAPRTVSNTLAAMFAGSREASSHTEPDASAPERQL